VKREVAGHKWMFPSRFRKHAFGWRGSRPAILRLKEAIAEIKKASKKDGLLGAEGAILLLEKLSPALAQVDSSSGAIGTTVNHAIDEMVKIIANAAVADDIRNHWLERLWRAIEEDNIPYLDLLPAYWGDLCVTPRLASAWADEFIGTVRLAWSPDPALRGFFKGTTACLSALYTAGRYDEILDLLETLP
jgi:hypothetical protein